MTICDLSSFYCEKGGGVSTFHRARIEWFARQTRHRYILISPGPRFQIRQLAGSVWTVTVHGARASRDPDRYRLLTDYRGVRAAVERFSPDLLETHDPWFSLPIGLLLRFRGPYRGLLTTYCHSDPIRTYVDPVLARWMSRSTVEQFGRWADRQLHRQHAACHAVFVASETTRQRLLATGVTRVSLVTFGVDPDLFRIVRRANGRPRRILYAGRLDDDKEFALVVDILSDLLRRADVHVTIAGAGKYAKRVGALSHPRLTYLGHISDRIAMRTLYAAHDILLAPGRYETFGLSALEGAAAGLVVVGPTSGGTGELLSQCGSPLGFSPGCASAFYDRVTDAIDGDHSNLIGRGRTMAARFGSWSDAIARHVRIYESLLTAGEAVVDPCERRRSCECADTRRTVGWW